MAQAKNTQPVTTPATNPEVSTPETPDSKIITMASAVLTGEIFAGDVSDVLEFRAAFGKFLEGLKGVAKSFDTQLVTLRATNGADFLAEVEHFRKPRESKNGGSNSLLDSLKL